MPLRSRAAFAFAFAFAFASVVLFVAACGSSSSSGPGSPDAGEDTSVPGPTFSCGALGPKCSTDGECCTASVPDGFGPEGFRCASGAWRSDSTCLPPPAPCASPLTGSLLRADGSSAAPTCFAALGGNGASVAVDPGGLLELYFDRAPAAGDVVPVIAYKDRSSHVVDAGGADGGDAGAPNAVALRLGIPGGFAGFSVEAESASGTVTITSIQMNASSISALHVTLDLQMTSSRDGSPWSGKLTGSW